MSKNDLDIYHLPSEVNPLTEEDVIGIITSQLRNIGSTTSILPSGKVTLKDVSAGGTVRQYAIGNGGILNFGDGSDGDVTISSDTTLTVDKYYDNLIIDTSFTLSPDGYRIFCRTSLIINGTGKIARNGSNGGNGGNGGNADSGNNGAAGAAGRGGHAWTPAFAPGWPSAS